MQSTDFCFMQDTARTNVAYMALGDMNRRYHFFLLHFTDIDSQAPVLCRTFAAPTTFGVLP